MWHNYKPPWALEIASWPAPVLPKPWKSPKSSEFPWVWICTYSIIVVCPPAGDEPPPNTPRVGEEALYFPVPYTLTESPKSVAFPLDAIVNYSITLLFPLPHATIPRVEDPKDPISYLPLLKSPKSVAFPVADIVTYSTLL